METGRKARGQEEKHVVVHRHQLRRRHAGSARKGEGDAAGPRSPSTGVAGKASTLLDSCAQGSRL